jgi:5-methylcytosine-specific restriction endonuclease McrA
MSVRTRQCLTDRCTEQVPYPGSRCLQHGGKKTGWTKYAQAHPDRAAFYKSDDWRWRRKQQLKANPNCRVCGRPATDADHIHAVALGGALAGELQSLCKVHHHAKTVADSHEGAKRRAAERRRNP